MQIKRGKKYEHDRILLECGGYFEVCRSKKYVCMNMQEDFSHLEGDERLLHEVFGSKTFLFTPEEASWLVNQIIDQIDKLEGKQFEDSETNGG